jgi:WD40 repeat protein
LGSLAGGGVALRSGSRLVFRDYFPAKEDTTKRYVDRVVFDGITGEEKIAVDPGGTAFARLAGGVLRAFRVTPDGSRPVLEVRPEKEVRTISVTRRFAACIDGHHLRVWSLEGGRELLHVKDWEARPETVALEDLRGLVAVGGWFDEILLYDLESGKLFRRFSASGRTNDLLILPDQPTIVAAKTGRIVLWREGTAPVAQFEAVGGDYTNLRWGSSGLLVYDTKGQRLVNLAYRSFPVEDRGAVAGSELWAMAADSSGKRLFLGSSDGRLHRFDLVTAKLESRSGHTQGVTSVVSVGSQVVTASDDKTIALWDAESLEVIARSKAHQFLVNFLFWEEASKTLWSTSSDHTVKAWELPGFVEREAIRLGEGSKSSMWIDSRRGLALVGTWQASWLELKRQGGAWALTRTEKLASSGVYCVAAQPEVGALLMVGVRPASLWAYDLQREAAWELPLPGQDLQWATPVGRDRLVVVGQNLVASYRFQRQADVLSWELSIGLSSDLGSASTATALPGSERIAAGTGDGRLLLIDTVPLLGHVAGRGELR